MPKKKLEQYKGAMTAKQIVEGINAAKSNARHLASDAAILLKSNRYPTAVSLAALSIEESGKVSILRSLVLARNDKEIAETWREYRSHTRKNVMWPFLDLVRKGARRLDDFRELFEENSEHPYLLDNIKQLGFYTDCLGNAHWSVPEKVIDKDLSQAIVDIANILASDREVTEKEIELWIKHLKPVWKGSKELMELALVKWHQEMQREGLTPKGENDMEKFIVEGLKKRK
jgi:AbiV family abortive infection protein